MSTIRTKKEQVYDYLKKEIISGNLKPGDWIQEKEIAKKLNVSRSPVRESLKELSVEGFTKNIPNKGVYVQKIELSDVLDIYEMRAVIEKFSINKIINNNNKKTKKEICDELDKLQYKFEKFFEKNDIHNYTKIDSKFHTTLVKLSNNKLAYEIFKKSLQKIQQFLIIPLEVNENRFNESYEEHLKIIEGIKNDDFSSSWKWDFENLSSSFKSTIKAVEEINHVTFSKNEEDYELKIK